MTDTRETELWQVLDWSLWGNGLGDQLREAIADTTLAAITEEQRETAENCIKAWHDRRGPSMAVGEGTALQKERDMLVIENDRLRQELRFEALGADTFTEADLGHDRRGGTP